MLHGGIAERAVNIANSLVGRVLGGRGGRGTGNMLGCSLFTGVAGSPLADVSAMGSVMIPLMKKEGHRADDAVNVTTHAALVGTLMPTLANLAVACGVAVKRGDPVHGPFPGRPAVLKAFDGALRGLLVVVTILSAILSGVFTATESLATAVCWTRHRAGSVSSKP